MVSNIVEVTTALYNVTHFQYAHSKNILCFYGEERVEKTMCSETCISDYIRKETALVIRASHLKLKLP